MTTELTWLGHGGWAIKAGGADILLDPFLTDCPTAKVSPDEVTADYILLSHGHFDHVADVPAIARRTGATVVSNFEICDWLSKQHGIDKTEPMNLGGVIDLPFGGVRMTLAHHSSQLPDGAYGGNPCGFYLNLNDGNVYFACDTGLFDDMRFIGALGVDLAVLPIGDRFTMGVGDSVMAVNLIGPGRVAPAHYNTWPPIQQDVSSWEKRVRDETSAEPVVIEVGEKITL